MGCFKNLFWAFGRYMFRPDIPRHLTTLLQEGSLRAGILFQITMNVFSRLNLATQEKIILDKYQNRALPNLPLVPYFDQALRVTFNKLTVSTALKVSTVGCLNHIRNIFYHMD